MNYRSTGTLTIIYGDGTRQEIGDAELIVENGFARICQTNVQMRQPPAPRERRKASWKSRHYGPQRR